MSKDYDIVVIGAGIAGLVCGNYLLDSGKRVLIIEKEKYPGGYACSFTRKGYKFDAAVHWISQAGEGGIVRKVLTDLGIADEVRFSRLPRPATVITADKRIDLEFGRNGIVQGLSDAFPSERARLEKLFNEVSGTKEELWRLIELDSGNFTGLRKILFNMSFPFRFGKIMKYHKKPASDVIAAATRNEELRAVLDSLGIFPDISFVHYSWFNSVGLDGDAFYPEGGIQAVPDALAARFISNGGEIRYGTLVESLDIADKAVRGVVTPKGVISADTVFSAGDATHTYLNLIGEERLEQGLVNEIKSWKPSESFFYVYIGADYDLKARGFDGSPVWYIPGSIDKAEFPMLGTRVLGIGMPSLLDPTLAPEGKNIIVMGMVASCDFMAGCPVKGGKDGNGHIYEAIKEKITDYLIQTAEGILPGLREKAEVVVSATPHTFERYTMNRNGASSGWSMAADRQHKLPFKTPIRNLYLTGHWTMNPGGVPAAFVSGMMAAKEIAPGG